MTAQHDDSTQLKKKPYAPPTITEYGALEDLTAGGTGNAQESSPGNSSKRV